MNQDIIDRWEGRDLKYNLRNRASGLAMLAFGMIFSSTNNTPLDIASYLFISEGAGDLLSGKHHYISSRIFRFHPRYSIKPTSD